MRQIATSIIDMFKGIALTSSYSSIQAGGSMHTRPRIPQLVMSYSLATHSLSSLSTIDFAYSFQGHIVSLKGIPKVSPESAWILWVFHASIRSYVAVIPFGTLLMKNPIEIHWSFKVYESIVRWTCSICLHYSAISDPKIRGSWDVIRPVTRSRDYGRGWICLMLFHTTWLEQQMKVLTWIFKSYVLEYV